MFCFGVVVFMPLVDCFVLELPSLCSWLIGLFWSWLFFCSCLIALCWSWRPCVPSWLFCFGFGVFIFLVECFVLDLASLYSLVNVLFCIWRLYGPWLIVFSLRLFGPSWLFCFGVDVFMVLVDCFLLDLAYHIPS